MLFQTIQDGIFPSLQHLLLGHNTLSSSTFELTEAIRSNSLHSIQHLSFHHCDLNKENFAHVIRAIRDYPLQRLILLNLAGNSLQTQEMEQLALQTLIFKEHYKKFKLLILKINQN